MAEKKDRSAVPAPAPSVPIPIAVAINREHQLGEQCQQEALEHYANAGELLIHANSQCKHGEWLSWLRENVVFSQPRAWQYMEAANYRRANNLSWDKWQEISGHATKQAHSQRTDDIDGDGWRTPN